MVAGAATTVCSMRARRRSAASVICFARKFRHARIACIDYASTCTPSPSPSPSPSASDPCSTTCTTVSSAAVVSAALQIRVDLVVNDNSIVKWKRQVSIHSGSLPPTRKREVQCVSKQSDSTLKYYLPNLNGICALACISAWFPSTSHDVNRTPSANHNNATERRRTCWHAANWLARIHQRCSWMRAGDEWGGIKMGCTSKISSRAVSANHFKGYTRFKWNWIVHNHKSFFS